MGDPASAQEAGREAAQETHHLVRRLLVPGRELGPTASGRRQEPALSLPKGGVAPGRAVPSSGLHRHQYVGWPRGGSAFLQWPRYCGAVDQGGQVCPELDPAVLPSVRGQPGEAPTVHLAYNLGNFLRRLCLPKAVKHWSLLSVQIKLIKIGARLVRHARRLVFQFAEVAVPREVFWQVLERIGGLHAAPG